MTTPQMMRVRAGWSRWSVVAAAAALLAVPWPPAASADVDDDVEEDPAVQEAQEEAERAREQAGQTQEALERQRETLGAVSAELDDAAASYEDANAHHQRLLDERNGSEKRVRSAVDASDAAREVFADQVAELYRRGPLNLRLSRLVLEAQSPSTALHRMGLLARVSAGSLDRLTGARRVATRTADDARQQEVVTVGTEAATERLRLHSDELALALQTAEQRVAAGRASLEEAEAEIARADAEVETTMEAAQRRIEAERRERIAAERLASRGQRLPAVDGMVCPVGAPHGFSDSWHAPRPGGRKHLGIDMFAMQGMPLYAVTSGTARVSSNRLGGLVIHLDADNGDRYYYAHLSAVSVSSGERVDAGDVIGANGNSGNARSTPPHLHWQYHPGGGQAVNPYPLARELCR